MKKYLHLLIVMGFFSMCVPLVNAQSIGFGSRGSDIASIQKILIQKGFLVGSADGVYGQNTVRAVQKFQSANNLTADGRIGTKTRTLLSANTSTVSNSTPSSSHESSPNTQQQSTCVSSKCVTLLSPNGGEVFNTGQTVSITWKSKGFNSFHQNSVDLVKKVGNDYVLVYTIQQDSSNGAGPKTEVTFPYALAAGQYAFKVTVHNGITAQGSVSDYSDKLFTVNATHAVDCQNPSVTVSKVIHPPVSDSQGIPLGYVYGNSATKASLGDYQIYASGGEDCIVLLRSIDFKANTPISNWYTQYGNNVTTTTNGDILTLTLSSPDSPRPLQLSGALIDILGKKQSSGVEPGIWGDYQKLPPKDGDFIDPIHVDAVDINGNPITNVVLQ